MDFLAATPLQKDSGSSIRCRTYHADCTIRSSRARVPGNLHLTPSAVAAPLPELRHNLSLILKCGTPKQAKRFLLPSEHSPVRKTRPTKKAGLTFHQGPFCTSGLTATGALHCFSHLHPLSPPATIPWLPGTSRHNFNTVLDLHVQQPPCPPLLPPSRPGASLPTAPGDFTLPPADRGSPLAGAALSLGQPGSRASRRARCSPSTASFEETAPSVCSRFYPLPTIGSH